jgi:hypothetical protein
LGTPFRRAEDAWDTLSLFITLPNFKEELEREDNPRAEQNYRDAKPPLGNELLHYSALSLAWFHLPN